jgi:hypothetical protein
MHDALYTMFIKMYSCTMHYIPCSQRCIHALCTIYHVHKDVFMHYALYTMFTKMYSCTMHYIPCSQRCIHALCTIYHVHKDVFMHFTVSRYGNFRRQGEAADSKSSDAIMYYSPTFQQQAVFRISLDLCRCL